MKNTQKKRKQDRTSFFPVLAAMGLVCILALVFFVSGGVGVYSASDPQAGDIDRTVQMLVDMEQQPPDDPASFQHLQEDADTMEEPGEPVELTAEDLSAMEEELLTHYGDYDYNSDYFRSWFEDAVIVGDSVADAIHGFGWVYDQNVQAQGGINLYSSQEVIDGTIWLQPSTVFMTFSANDIAAFGTDVDTYIQVYSSLVQQLMDEIPGVQVYVQGILPCDPDFREEYWYYDYMDDYNAALEEMCDQLGAHYYDAGFVLRTYPETYNGDGFHPSWEFYPLWLTYMAEIAGLDR